MKFIKAIFLFLFTGYITFIQASPSSVFWTYTTTDVVPTGTLQLQVYNFFTVFNSRGHGQQLPTDIGVTLGIFTWKDLSMEAGIDYLGGTDFPLYLNTKIGMEEDKLFKYAPSWSLGIFNVGTRHHGPLSQQTDQNIGHLVFGKTLPDPIGGKLCFGGFAGNKCMGKDRYGYTISYLRYFIKVKDCDNKEYHKWAFAADYASGKNTYGAGGACIAYFFTPDIYIETGPVFFNTAKYNGRWKWATEIYFNIPVFKKS